LASNPLKGLFIFGFILAIAQSGVAVFLPLLADNQQLTKTQIGILASAFVFVAGILQPYFGRLSNRYNKVKMVLIGTLIIAIGLAYLPSTNGFWILLSVAIFIGIAAALASPAANAMIVEHSREIGLGVVSGTMNAFTSLGMIIGPIGAGIVMDKINLNSAFYLYSLIFIIGTALFYYFIKDSSHVILDTHYDKYTEQNIPDED
ncbi:MAG: MFS transporter, partial [Bacteroidales bacterium]|nr:MFS transporter [Bacteroidales bacterium]